MKLVYIETYGCWLNKGEANALKQLLKKHHFKDTNDPKKADIIILYTCAVRGDTERKILKRIKNLYEHIKNTNKKFIIASCLVNIRPRTIRELAPKASLIEPNGYHLIPSIIEYKTPISIVRSDISRANVLPYYSSGSFYVLPIQSGCVGNCSFCVGKIARKTLKSYPPDLIIDLVRQAVKHGAREIFLTGQDVASYGIDLNLNLVDLLTKIIDNIEGNYWIRLGMMEPWLVMKYSDELLEIIKDPHFFKYLHIPLQSGDNKVLRYMNRRYTVEEFYSLIKKFRRKIPDINITTDIIVGHPGEGEKEFKNTIYWIKKIKFDKVHVARYTFRPFTKAYIMNKQVAEHIKKRRSRVLTKIVLNEAYRINRRLIGRRFDIVIEKRSRRSFIGRTFNYKPVVLDINQIEEGERIRVEIINATAIDLRGKII